MEGEGGGIPAGVLSGTGTDKEGEVEVWAGVSVYIGDHKIPVGVLSGSDTAGEWALILCFFCSSRCSLLAASV